MSLVTDNILRTIDYAIDKKMEKVKQMDEYNKKETDLEQTSGYQ